MKRTFILFFLIVLLSIGLLMPVNASEIVNDEPNPGGPSVFPAVKFIVGINSYYASTWAPMDACPFILEGRTFVPVRYMAEPLGAHVGWDEPTQRITIFQSYHNIHIVLQIDNKTLVAGGVPSQMEVAPVIVNGRAYLPARYVAEAMGYLVKWDSNAQAVSLYDKNLLRNFTQEQIDQLK
ncbi:MAG: copper amine oxidase N-terminal domain-containing protein [Eubacteriales bacterium]